MRELSTSRCLDRSRTRRGGHQLEVAGHERAEISDELFGLFECGEVSAVVDVGPPSDGIGVFGELARPSRPRRGSAKTSTTWSLDSKRVPTSGEPVADRFSPVEMKVLACLPTHQTLADIAKQLYISHNTAKSQSVATYRTLGVTKRAEARTSSDRHQHHAEFEPAAGRFR